MKTILSWLCMSFLTYTSFSQTVISKSYPLQKGKQLSLYFDYPQLVRLSTWDKNEVAIVAHLKIAGATAQDVFRLNEQHSDSVLEIRNYLDMDRIPYDYVVVEENGIKNHLTEEDFITYQAQHSGPLSYSKQRNIQISLEIKVPAQTNTQLNAVYGMVELIGFEAPIRVEAKYGGIDASLDKQKIGKIKLTNHYGKIYTNLPIEPIAQEERNFYTSITATPGKGPSYDIRSSYGNIYLRQVLSELRK